MSNLHILVVDDEPSMLEVIASFLTHRGDRHATARSGDEALALMQLHDFDLMFTDLTMPGMDGLELTRRVKAVRPTTVCILMSGRGTRLDVIAAMQIGVFDFLDKPFPNLAGLTMVLERAATSRRLVRERDALLDDLKKQNGKLELSLTRLHSAYGQLRQQEESLESDLKQAQRVQRKLLPGAFPSLDGFELFGYFGPCERLGGDFFGVVPLGHGRLAVYLTDVAGHGVSAAMITIILRELLQPRRLAQVGQEILGNPEAALTFLNRALLEEAFDPPILVTMIYAVIDAKAGTLAIASAGHPPPVFTDGPAAARVISVSGPVLGLPHPGAFIATTLTLSPGDSVVLYSDGVSEARCEGGREFTPARLCAALASRHGQHAAGVGHALEGALLAHLDGHAPVDDITFIVISRTAVSAPGSEPAGEHAGSPAAESIRVSLPANIPPPRTAATGGITAGWSAATCVITLSGLATWQVSPALRALIATADAEGMGAVSLDLAGCEAFDSTMLGLAYQFAHRLILHKPGSRVRAQFREMGIFERFQISEAAAPEIDTPMTVTPDASRAACSVLVLSAHEALMRASEENRRRFQGVVNSF